MQGCVSERRVSQSVPKNLPKDAGELSVSKFEFLKRKSTFLICRMISFRPFSLV